LECVAIETSGPLDETLPVVNTATVSSATFDTDPTNNSDSASILIARAAGSVPTVAATRVSLVKVANRGLTARAKLTCATDAACAGTVKVTAKVRGKGPKRVVIGQTRYQMRPGVTKQVKVSIKKKYRAKIRHDRLKGFRVG
ncbi:MAG: hypothetical protein WBP61_19870, partial [Nocardioides sp.]